MEPAFTDLGDTDAILYDRATFFLIDQCIFIAMETEHSGARPWGAEMGKVTDCAYIIITIQISWDE